MTSPIYEEVSKCFNFSWHLCSNVKEVCPFKDSLLSLLIYLRTLSILESLIIFRKDSSKNRIEVISQMNVTNSMRIEVEKNIINNFPFQKTLISKWSKHHTMNIDCKTCKILLSFEKRRFTKIDDKYSKRHSLV